jgi:hypothetical protein
LIEILAKNTNGRSKNVLRNPQETAILILVKNRNERNESVASPQETVIVRMSDDFSNHSESGTGTFCFPNRICSLSSFSNPQEMVIVQKRTFCFANRILHRTYFQNNFANPQIVSRGTCYPSSFENPNNFSKGIYCLSSFEILNNFLRAICCQSNCENLESKSVIWICCHFSKIHYRKTLHSVETHFVSRTYSLQGSSVHAGDSQTKYQKASSQQLIHDVPCLLAC